MNHQVQLFQIDRDAKPTDRALPMGGFAVTADSYEAARQAALAHLQAEGRTVRALSF
ncbi:MAG: hypothetical protein HOO96_00555, partial [Polyangiaceae bacterium]|nr:hypothetical protein [Polyangiaceae bacterium]